MKTVNRIYLVVTLRHFVDAYIPHLVRLHRDIVCVTLFWLFVLYRVIIKILTYCQHKLSEEGLVFIALGGTLASLFGTLKSEAELHFTFNALLKQ